MNSPINTVVAIHQPNFFPWLGYFDKIIKSNIFVFMDNVAYPKSGSGSGSWSNRVKLLVQEQPHWWGGQIVREHGVQFIRNVQWAPNELWRKKLIKTLEFNYKRCPYFDEYFDWICAMILRDTENLAAYNILNISDIAGHLDIKANFVVQSSLDTQKSSTDLLIEITQKVDGMGYLCGGGASAYQEDEKFAQVGIEVIYQNFKHPQYTQHNNSNGKFVPGLSIIDALMNCGTAGTKQLLGIE